MTRHGLIGFFVAMALAVPLAQAPVVEVSSVKVNKSQQPGGVIGGQTPSGVRLVGADLLMNVAWAYGIDFALIRTKVDWSRVDLKILGTLYDIDIIGTGDRRALLRQVFSDRFGLTAHMETRRMRLSALTMKTPGRLGPNLKPSSVNCLTLLPATPRPPQCVGGRRFAGPITELIRREVPHSAGRPVVDQTGLTGNYEWSLTTLPPRAGVEWDDIVREALDSQLGLTLKDITGPYEVLVIDALHEPTPN